MAGLIAPCPYLPNCVCSRDDASPRHRVEPIAVTSSPATDFARVKDLVARLPRTTIVTATDDYVHAVCRTRIGFVDELECRLCPEDRIIHVRSASRLGLWDFGVNRARIEAIRRGYQGR